ncbi:abc transporter [Nannochloropsis gaditana]|uniref:Abc transporter n=1 Tax=Nannochloropsis gaditana TaxID=72520 RepID=W7U344_9STRA|nr:abc transporter [Nannochloropsis gaditana]
MSAVMSSSKDKVGGVVTSVLQGLDEQIADYLTSVLEDDPLQKPDDLEASVGPFLLSTEFAKDDAEVSSLCLRLSSALSQAFGDDAGHQRAASFRGKDDVPALLSAPLSFKENTSAADDKLMDLMWGKDKVRQARNEQFFNTSSISKRQERKQRRLLEADESSDEEEEQVSMMILPDYSSGSGEKDINVLGFVLRFAGQELLSNADLRMAYGRRYGLIGANGIGKTTLLKHIAAFEIEGFPRHHRVLHVKQEVRSSGKTVLETVLQSDVEREALMEEEKEILKRQQQKDQEGGGGASSEEVEADSKRLTEIYERLNIIGSNSAEARAAAILNGLQFSLEMQASSTCDLSGGWRMRVALASALFIEPDLLLLDEPTNHLDLEAVLWLQEYLKTYKHTVLLVSHDRAFLNEVTTDIVEFKNKTLTYYRGNYDTFEAVRSEKAKNQRRLYEANMAKRAHMQDFIDKFRYNANRAALVQSRIKALEKLEVVDPPEDDTQFRFHLPIPEPLGRPVINIESVSFGYPKRGPGSVEDEGDGKRKKKEKQAGEEEAEDQHSENDKAEPVVPKVPAEIGKVLFENVDFGVDLETRIGVVGANGAGKSTLLNLILDKLRPTEGHIFRHHNLRLASFTQHHGDQFDLRLSAVENFESMFPKSDTQELRSLVGKFGLSGNDAIKPMRFLSGGQKSRAAFALLAHRKPHIVILDEPTNHLDMDTIQALIEALKEFRGGLLVVSHDQHFIEQVTSDIYVCGNNAIKRFNGTFDEYKKVALSKVVGGSKK